MKDILGRDISTGDVIHCLNQRGLDLHWPLRTVEEVGEDYIVVRASQSEKPNAGRALRIYHTEGFCILP